jgi:hypothetical protein
VPSQPLLAVPPPCLIEPVDAGQVCDRVGRRRSEIGQDGPGAENYQVADKLYERCGVEELSVGTDTMGLASEKCIQLHSLDASRADTVA